MAKKNKKAKSIEAAGKVKKLLPVQIDLKAKQAKEAEIRELLTANVLLKEKAKPFTDKRKQNTERVDKLRKEAESLTEEREVQCEVVYDFAHRAVKYKRLDTKKFVPELERTMEDEDRQEDLLAGKRAKKAKASKAVPEPGTIAEQNATMAEHEKHFNDVPADEQAAAEA